MPPQSRLEVPYHIRTPTVHRKPDGCLCSKNRLHLLRKWAVSSSTELQVNIVDNSKYGKHECAYYSYTIELCKQKTGHMPTLLMRTYLIYGTCFRMAHNQLFVLDEGKSIVRKYWLIQ